MGAQSAKFLDKLDQQALKDALLLEAARDNGAVATILEHGANPDARDANGATPLHMAAANGHINVVKLLVIRGGADIDARDNQGRTALHIAAQRGHQGVINALITLGASKPGAGENLNKPPRVHVVQPGQKNVRVKLELHHKVEELPALLHLNASSAVH